MTPSDQPILAGAAAVDVTPEPGCFLVGFGRGRVAEHILDPLWARAVALRVGHVTAAILAVDCLALTVAQAQAIAAATPLPLGRLLVCATHTHTGPDTIGLWGPDLATSGVSEAVVARLVAGGAAAVNQALDHLQPAVLTFSRTLAPQRCAVNVRAPELIDKAVTVMHLAAADHGQPLATLLNWACHPETLARTCPSLSSDFADGLRRRVETRLGGLAVFVNGALGAMVTPACADSSPAEAARIGESVADAAVAALRATDELVTATRLDIATREVALALETPTLREAVAAGGVRLETDADGLYRVPVSAWGFGPSAWLAIPGEVAPALGLQWKRMMRRRHRLLLGLANGEVGYILPDESWPSPSYAYERTMSLGPATAAGLQDAVCRVLAAVDA